MAIALPQPQKMRSPIPLLSSLKNGVATRSQIQYIV